MVGNDNDSSWVYKGYGRLVFVTNLEYSTTFCAWRQIQACHDRFEDRWWFLMDVYGYD